MVAIHEAYLEAIKNRDFSRTRELVDQQLLGLCSKYHVFPFADASKEPAKHSENLPKPVARDLW